MVDKVSILVPLSNNEPKSDVAINSIIDQNYRNLEILVCLNGNTNSFNKKIKDKYKKFKNVIFYNYKKKNIVDSLNFLIEKSRGKYLARFDADDINYKNRITNQLKYLKKMRVDFLSSNCNVYYNNKFSYAHKTDLSKSFYTNPIIHPTIFLKRDILTKYKYNQIPFAEDYELYLRLYLSGYKLKNISKNLIIYNLNTKNIKDHKRAFYLFLSTLVVSKGFRDKLKINPNFFSKIKLDKNFANSYNFYMKKFILNRNKYTKIFFGIFFIIFSHKLIKKNILNYLFFRKNKLSLIKTKKKNNLSNRDLVSFIVPTFNSEKTIYKTLKSIFDQTYTNKEVIVVDNSKNNETINIINKHFKNVKIIKLKKYVMPAEARNIGVRNTSKNSKFLSFCDSDDILKPNKTSYQVEKMISENSEISCANADFYNVKQKKLYKNYFNYPFQQINFKDLCFKNIVITSSVIVSKKLFNSVNGFPESNYFYSYEDYFLWLKILNKTKISFLDKSLLIYMDNREISASSRSKNIFNQRLRILFYYIKFKNFKIINYIVLGNLRLAHNWIEKKLLKKSENEYINLL